MKADLTIVTSEQIDVDVRLFVVLNLLHSGEISLKKAYELCTEIGVFTEHWVGVDARLVEAARLVEEKE